MFKKYDIKWSLETIKSEHNYKLDHIFKLSKYNICLIFMD